MTESEVLATIESVVRKSFRRRGPFGYVGRDDLCQQARLFALEALPRWDGKRPLENFLFVHVCNRLINYRRDNYRRNDPPCRKCHVGKFCGEGEGPCARYVAWEQRNERKAGVLRPFPIEDDDRPGPDTAAGAAVLNELEERVGALLCPRLREAYLRLRDGLRVPEAVREELATKLRGTLCPGD